MRSKNQIFDQKNPNLFIESKIIAQPIIEKIQKTLENGGSVFLAASQKGVSGGYFCQNCGYIPKCQKCQRIFYLKSTKTLKCPLCNRQKQAPQKCPKCQNAITKTIGLGIKRVFEEAKKLFPNKNTVFLNLNNRKNFICLKTVSQSSTIFVGSLKSLRASKFNKDCKLAVILNSDKTFFIPEFNANEQKFQEIRSVLSENFPVFIQTKYCENEIFDLALNQNYPVFYKKELALRKSQKLPPFTKLIKFSIKDKDVLQAEKILARLGKKLQAFSDFAFFSEVYPGYPEKITDRYIFHLIIGFKNDREKLKIKNKQILEYCRKNKIIIDVDPIGFL
ncbi:MAG: hypothetical protein GF335_03665 [Candidatus Moranbacteria bacterium]|nr:hypothetical protein [Candidatus Moranbacteria bacterium]